jgi:hypothetical protein
MVESREITDPEVTPHEIFDASRLKEMHRFPAKARASVVIRREIRGESADLAKITP